MESVYEPHKFPTTNKLTDLKEYFSKYVELYEFESNEMIKEINTNDELIQKHLSEMLKSDLKPSEIASLKELCSIDNLFVTGEVSQTDVPISSKYTMKVKRDYGITENASELNTIKAKLKYDTWQPRKKEFANILLRYKFGEEKDIEPGSDILVLVRIYQPFGGVFDRKLQSRYERLKCNHEIYVLGSQTLAELRDKILCANDSGICVEVKDVKDDVCTEDVKKQFPSGLICIDNILYNDMREPNAVDYSSVIKKWGKMRNICTFKTANMDEVRIDELIFRLGYPYVYQHRGNCEHIIVFSDLRLIKKSDPLFRMDYPYYRTVNRYNAQHCNICRVSTAKWMCVEADRLPHDRTFLCHECYVSYNYIDDKKIGHVKTYPYYAKSLVY